MQQHDDGHDNDNRKQCEKKYQVLNGEGGEHQSLTTV